MKPLKHLRGLPDLNEDRENVMAVLAAGRKGSTGAPIESDRFHILCRDPVRQGGKDVRDHHPEFSAYNSAPPKRRRLVHAIVPFASEEEFWDPGFYAHRAPPGKGTSPTHKGPWCHGNGIQAERWDGKAYRDIPCPGNECPFRLPIPRGKSEYTPCARGARIYFMPRWRDGSSLPSGVMKLKTNARAAVDSFASLLASVRKLTEDHNIDQWTWLGLPFSITVGQVSSAKGLYSNVGFALDGEVMDWLAWQRSKILELQAAPQRLLGAASESERDPEQEGLDHDTITATAELVKPAREAQPRGGR